MRLPFTTVSIATALVCGMVLSGCATAAAFRANDNLLDADAGALLDGDPGRQPLEHIRTQTHNAGGSVVWSTVEDLVGSFSASGCAGQAGEWGTVTLFYGPISVVVSIRPCSTQEIPPSSPPYLVPTPWDSGDGSDDPQPSNEQDPIPLGLVRDVTLQEGPVKAEAFFTQALQGVGPGMLAPSDVQRAVEGWTRGLGTTSVGGVTAQSALDEPHGQAATAFATARAASSADDPASAQGAAAPGTDANSIGATLSMPFGADEDGQWRVEEEPDPSAPTTSAQIRLAEGGRDTSVDVTGRVRSADAGMRHGTSASPQSFADGGRSATANGGALARAAQKIAPAAVAPAVLGAPAPEEGPPLDPHEGARAPGPGAGAGAVNGRSASGIPAPVARAAAGALVATAGAALCVFYSRLSRNALAQQETRGQILRHIGERPGSTYADISHALGLHRTTARYHIRLLARESLVVTRGTGGRLRCFLPGSDQSQRVAEIATLQADPAKRIAEAVTTRPGLSIHEAAEVAGIHRVTVHYHVKRMAAAGVLRVERDGRALRLFRGAPRAPDAPGGTVVATPL